MIRESRIRYVLNNSMGDEDKPKKPFGGPRPMVRPDDKRQFNRVPKIMGPKTADKARKKAFAREWVKDRNATAAAKRCNLEYAQSAYQLLKDDIVKKEIARIDANNLAKANVTVERVVLELSRIAFHDPLEISNFVSGKIEAEDLSDQARAALCEVKIVRNGKTGTVTRQVKTLDRLRALELLAKMAGIVERTAAEEDTHKANTTKILPAERIQTLRRQMLGLDEPPIEATVPQAPPIDATPKPKPDPDPEPE